MLVESSTQLKPVDSIHIHKINVISPIKKQITQYTNIANTTPESLPIIQLGRIHDKLYVLADFGVFYGIKKSRLTSITCNITDFKNDVEFIIQHVKLNKDPTGFNQFLLFKVINYLKSQNIQEEKTLELLQINHTIHHKLLELPLHIDTIQLLSELHEFLSEKLTIVNIPYYIPEIISKSEQSKQTKITKEIIELVKAFTTTDSRFSFPAIEALRVLLIKPVENKSTVITPEHVQPTEQQKKIVENIISTSNNVTCILGDKDNPTYLFNKKTNTLSTVNVKDTIISLDETPSQKIYALPPNIVKYLKLEEIDKPLKIKKFSKSSDLISYLKKDSGLQGVVLFK